MSAASLVGAWELVALYRESAEGRTHQPFGDRPVGLIMYTADGSMSAVLMRRDRTSVPDEAGESGSPGQTTAPSEEFTAYCGTYRLDPARGAVVHHVEVSHDPEMVGNDLVRYFEIDGDTLHITTDPAVAMGEDWVTHVIWRARR